jgi:tRNA(His) guanylyltransferase
MSIKVSATQNNNNQEAKAGSVPTPLRMTSGTLTVMDAKDSNVVHEKATTTDSSRIVHQRSNARANVVKASKYKNDLIGNKVKELEENTPPVLRPDYWTVLRIDGHSFHTFVKGFDRPSDANLSSAMIKTTIDLMKEFHAVTGYTQSDEITLLLLPTEKDPATGMNYPMIFSGRKQKLESLSAGFASARFNWHLQQECNGSSVVSQKKKDKINSGRAFFDSRAIMVETLSQVEEIFMWRYFFDCYKNGVSALSHSVFSPKMLHKKTTKEQLVMLQEKGIILNTYSPHLFFGTWCKRAQVLKKVTNKKTGNEIECTRVEFSTYSIPRKQLPQPFHEWLASKYDSQT